MGILDEAVNAPTQLAASLAAGIAQLSDQQQIVFAQYSKFVSPVDGYVFWIRTGSVFTYSGSLHQTIEQNQDEDQTIAINKMVFTSTQEISQFNQINPGILYVGTWLSDGVTVRVVFNEALAVYQQAGLWHYSGEAVYPALQAQLVSSTASIPASPVVSNSLPIWLTQNSYAPVYPSFLVPNNVVPPYVVAHIAPEDTDVLGQFPIYQWPASPVSGFNQMSSSQLMRDKVRLTLYGFNNQMAIQYLVSLMQYSLNTDNFGFCNSPSIRDDKRKQSEISAIAMKKTIEIHASYYQSTADAISQRLISEAALNAITFASL